MAIASDWNSDVCVRELEILHTTENNKQQGHNMAKDATLFSEHHNYFLIDHHPSVWTNWTNFSHFSVLAASLNSKWW